MKIGFDVSQTGAGATGCGWYARSLVDALAEIDRRNDYILYPTFGDLYWSPRAGADTVQPTARNFRRGPRRPTLQSLQAFWRAPPHDWERRLGDPDVIHSNSYFCPPAARRARLVYTLYDLSFLDEPEWSTEANRVGCFGGVFRASLEADLVIAISEHARTRFLHHFPHFPAERAVVLPPSSRFSGRPPSRRPGGLSGLRPGYFWLHVGTIEPRKNLDHLLIALATVAERDPERRPLVLSGARGWLMESWTQRAADLGVADLVQPLGYVDDAALQWLYENCTALLFPSHYEGFGMPVLEAMSLGAAVIASNATAIPEVVGDSGILIDPRQPSTTAAAMLDLLEHPERRSSLGERALARAARHSWRELARGLIDCYARVFEQPRAAQRPPRAL